MSVNWGVVFAIVLVTLAAILSRPKKSKKK